MKRSSRNRDRSKTSLSDNAPNPWAATAAVLAVAMLLRTVMLGRDELWFDEAYAALVASGSVGSIFAELARDSSPPLYFLLLQVWGRLLGFEATTLRMLSVVLGVGAVYLVGRC